MAYVATDVFGQRPDIATMQRAIQGNGQPPPQGWAPPQMGPAQGGQPMPPQMPPQGAPMPLAPPMPQPQMQPQSQGPAPDFFQRNSAMLMQMGLAGLGASRDKWGEQVAQASAIGAATDLRKAKDDREAAEEKRKQQSQQLAAQSLARLIKNDPALAEEVRRNPEAAAGLYSAWVQHYNMLTDNARSDHLAQNDDRRLKLSEDAARAKPQVELGQVDPNNLIYNKQTGQWITPPGVGGDPNTVSPQTQKTESGLRDEVRQNQTMKNFEVVQDNYRNILSVRANPNPTGPDDMALVYAFMKMNDPNSAVRETEYATAENAGGVPDKVRNLWNKLRDGDRLPPELRASFTATAEKLYEANANRYETERGRFESLAKSYKADPKRVLTPYERLKAKQAEDNKAATPPITADPAAVEAEMRRRGLLK